MKHLLITIAAVVLVGCWPSISIHKAAEEGNIYVVKQHLAAGADANAKNKKGMTPLHFAIYKDNSEIVELLIDKGADVNAKAGGGYLLCMLIQFNWKSQNCSSTKVRM